MTSELTSLFDRIRAASAHRDAVRELPYADVAELAAQGFTALRVPRELGGAGLTGSAFTELALQLAAADSNIVQALRTHALYTEALVLAPPSEGRDAWLRRIGDGGIIGGAATERTATNSDRFGTTVTRDASGRRVVNGTKYYSTGSLYADWFATIAEDEDGGLAHVVVRTDAPGLQLVDDWDGFGQRLTASGTSHLRDVEVDEDLALPEDLQLGSYATSFAQQLHLIALAGIARAAFEDVVDYVRQRKRYFAQGERVEPRHDPLVREIVGELSSAVHLAETLVRQVAVELDGLAVALAAGEAGPEREDHVEIQVYRAQHLVVNAVLAATTRLFDVGGASSLSSDKGWDRHWRNARTLATHNPISYRLTAIGDHELNGTSPFRQWFSGVDLRGREADLAGTV